MIRSYFITLSAIAFAPLILALPDHILPLFPLSGSFEEKAPPQFTLADFASKKFQASASSYLDATFPVRSIFIRFRNQVHKTVYGTIHAKKIVEGRDGYYYENDHVAAYLGTDFKDPAAASATIRKARSLQTLLEKKGKTFLIVLAPGKARIYPSYIPPSPPYSENNYYNLLRQELDRSGVHYFDSIAYLKTRMQKDPLTFYPRYGTHWSVWGAAHVWQQVTAQVRSISRRKIPEFTFHQAERTVLPRQGTTDSDLFDSLNLMWSLSFGTYLYPEVQTGAGEKLSLLAIGDSFYQTFYAFQGPQSVFDPHRSEFRFYNKIVYPDDGRPSKKSAEAPLSHALLQADVVILLVSEVNFKWFGYGFVEEAVDILSH